jgi:hypothetical protein
VLRPLRMISRDPGMKIVVESLINSIPGIVNLMVITVLILLLFAILGTTFYKGVFRYCHTENITETSIKPYTMWECLDAGGEWINPPANFDNVLNSMLTLFTAVTTEGWVGIMWQGVDATYLH